MKVFRALQIISGGHVIDLLLELAGETPDADDGTKERQARGFSATEQK